MRHDIRALMLGAVVAVCAALAASPALAIQCADDAEVSNLTGTITSMTAQPYTAGGTSLSGHWIYVSAPSLSCGGFQIYVLDARNDGLVGLDGHYCQTGGTISVTGTLLSDLDDPNKWSASSASMLPATYGADFTC
jgi:hypothetical protein